MDPEVEIRWYAVRTLFRAVETPEAALPDLAEGESAYEERITLWQATSFEEAIARAEEEAAEYAEFLNVEHVSEFAQAYHVADVPPRDGSEIFSLIRYSPLAPEPYVDRFFDTGTERQEHVDPEDE
ncbi:MAG: hypothetical protein JWO77_141 [Ilumatobacteraceae bacterium]|nr:hypothetical protein [Ilumatobacteraceae bacterium]